MARTYTDQEPVPAAVITLATQESNLQHIIFQTRYDVEGFYSLRIDQIPGNKEKYQQKREEPCPNKLEWAIKALSVSLFRDWSTSTARVTLACNLDDASAFLPPLPKVDQFRGGQYPYLTIDDEIRIYAGYVAGANTNISAEMLDDIPIRLQNSVTAPDGTQVLQDIENYPQPNPEVGKLVPIFWGFIDKIDYDGSAKGSGHQVILSCRDRVRVLSDTTLINIPSLNGVFGNTGSTVTPQGRLSQIVSDVARAVNGYQINVADVDQDDLNCWKTIITPNESLDKNSAAEKSRRRQDTDARNANDPRRSILSAAENCEFYSAYDLANQGVNVRTSSTALPDTKDPSGFVRRASFKPMDAFSRPRFHMWLSRPPLTKNGEQSQWQVLDETPLKIIKWVATKEERSMDFFASHVNGDFCLVPRVLDTSGLLDEDRMYRTYFFRSYPPFRTLEDGSNVATTPPCRAQVILNLRCNTSIVGTFNRFTIVDNSNVSGAGLAMLQGVRLTIDRVPFILEGRDKDPAKPETADWVTPPCRQKLIYDGNLSNYGNQFGGALIVAQSVSAQLSRDVSGIEFTLLGDPTMYPGEAVRVYNTFLHDSFFQTQTGELVDILNKEAEQDKFFDFWSKNTPDSNRQNKKGEIDKTDDEKIVLTNKKDSETVKIMQESGTMITDARQLRLPVYKIRSIEHRLKTQGKNAGYTTVVAASMDINN